MVHMHSQRQGQHLQKFAQVCTWEDSTAERGSEQQIPSLTQKQSTIDNCSQWGDSFSPMESHRVPHTHQCMPKTKWTQWHFQGFFVSSCSVRAFSFFPYRAFVHMLCFYRMSACLDMCLCIYMCFLCLSLILFLVLVSLFWPFFDLFDFLSCCSLDAY